MKSQAISWWFTPFYYPYRGTGSTTRETIETHYNRLRENNEEPSLFQKLTPARATSLTMSSLGLASFLTGLFRGCWKLSTTGALTTIIGVASFWSDRFLLKNDSSSHETSDAPQHPEQEQTPTPIPTTPIEPEGTEDTPTITSHEVGVTETISLSEDELIFYADIIFSNPNTPLSSKKDALAKLNHHGSHESEDNLMEYLFDKNPSIRLWAFSTLLQRESPDKAINSLLNNLDNQEVIDTLLEATKLDSELFENTPEAAYSILKAGHSATGSVKLLKALSSVPEVVYQGSKQS